MRALCEGCGKPQPPDWKAGDLCSHCGKSVRHDVRCYWCAKWVPAAKFCRSCGAAVVEERLYGAARMLKDAGTDRFTIPKQLKDFDPDQIENFSRIYQRHAVAVARHVDEVRFLERFLYDKSFSAALEDQLIPQLPWPEETLARMSAPTPKPADDGATAKTIFESTPFATTQALAALVRLKLRDGDSYKEACSVFYSSDPAIKAEAALQLTGWRIAYSWGRPRNLDRELAEELQKSTHKLEAAVRLGIMNRGNEALLQEALTSPDPETAFGAALVLGDVDRLQAALKGDDQQKSAAGSKLISMGIIKPVVEPIRKSAKEVQWELVESLARRKEAAPEAADTLLEIVDTTDDSTLRERASRILCRQLKPGWVLRIARKAGKERSIIQNLLQAPDLQPESALELADFLIEQGQFTMNQYGMSHVAESGVMPLTFVPTRFARANDEMRKELLRFAETQIQKDIDEPLHRFLMKVVFGPYSPEVRAAAWWTLHRSYRSGGEYRGEGPLKLSKEQLTRFFGSVADFVPLLAEVLRSRETLKEVGYYELIAELLRSADEETVAEMQVQDRVTDDLIEALLQAATGDFWPNTLESIVILLSQVGSHPRWRDRVLSGLRGLGKKGNYYYDKAVRRLELSKHGIPEESDWDKLPQDFVPSRFWDADDEGKREYLKIVEHQLIHTNHEKDDPILSRFLLHAAMTVEDREIAEEAMHLHSERAPRELRRLQLKKASIEGSYGPFAEFLEAFPKALRAALASERRDVVEFFGHLFSDPQPEDGPMLAAEGDLGHAAIRAVVETAAAPVNPSNPGYLRRDAIRFLSGAGAHPTWRKEVVQALERLQETPGTDQKTECEMLLRKIKPPKPLRTSKKASAHPREEEEPLPPMDPEASPSAVDYGALGKIAEKMGTDLQAKIFKLMAGPGSPEKKMKEATRLSEEFQAAVKKLYGQ